MTDVAEVREIYQKFRPQLTRYHGGASVGFLAAIIKHESGGRMDSRGDPVLGEVGVFQIEASFPGKVGLPADSRYDLETNIFLGCLEYQIRAVEVFLSYPKLVALGSEDNWKLARLGFAIGSGGTRTLIEGATGGSIRHRGAVFLAVKNYVNRTGGQPLGSQSAAKVQARVNAVEEQWSNGIRVAGAYYGAPEKIPSPRGTAYAVPQNVARYLSSPIKQIALAAAFVGIAAGAIALTKRFQ